jgi:hypothetical protein
MVYGASFAKYCGKDLYGFYFSIYAFSKLVNQFPNIGLLLIIPDKVNNLEIEKLLEVIKSLKLNNKVLVFNDPIINMSQLYKKINIYLRPTLTDGDSLAVREALSFGKIVIASDASYRPEGCIIYKSEDMEDYILKIKMAISQNNLLPAKKVNIENRINYLKIKEIYENI